MPIFRAASGLVIRCFKRVEHVADAITGAAGPVFIALAWILTAAGGIVFCESSVSTHELHTALSTPENA